MKAFIIAAVALAVIVFVADRVLDGETVAASDRFQVRDSVRLDDSMRSNAVRRETAE